MSGAFAALLAASCRPSPSPSAFVVVDAPARAELDLGTARVDGSGVRAVTLSNGKLVIERDARAADDLSIHVAQACSLRVTSAELARPGTLRRTIAPFFDFGEPAPQVGFGKRFEVVARPGCAEAARARVTWKQTAGLPLAALALEDDGRKLVATTPPLPASPARPRFGIVPLSARTRGEVELRASYSDGGAPSERVVHVSAAARSRGLPNVGASARLYLAGDGFRVLSRPDGSHADLEVEGGTTALTPDRTGSYTLEDASGRTLRLFAGRYDETPLDCGRSDCHAEIAQSARSNPMTTILQRGLDGPFAGDYPACALGCHATGEPGLDDGGFVAVKARFGLSPADLRRSGFHDLPASLRRLGGVGCQACHGPGTVAEPAGRDALLRADVCAICHDAPPRYGHVAAWESSRMARADADPRTREGACARCHTTWGFLGESARKPADDAPPVGIACAACHAVHPARAAAESVIGATCAAKLRREAPVPALLTGALASSSDPSRACFSCHAPDGSTALPAASAAAIWAGRGGLEPRTGAALDGAAPHGGVAGGCIGCHRSGPSDLGRGSGHGFAARGEACTSCHAEKSDPAVRQRALALWSQAGLASTTRVAVSDAGDPLHASSVRLQAASPRGRALWDVALVLEDRAADRHNAAYARALLDAAERVLAPRAQRREAP